MTNHSDAPESDRPVEQQGLPTLPVEDNEPGRSFTGDEPDAGSDGSTGTQSDDLDAEDADAAREADEAGRSIERGRESQGDPEQSYGTDPTSRDAPPSDVEQPIQNPSSDLARELD
jgi:hypothetical protein